MSRSSTLPRTFKRRPVRLRPAEARRARFAAPAPEPPARPRAVPPDSPTDRMRKLNDERKGLAATTYPTLFDGMPGMSYGNATANGAVTPTPADDKPDLAREYISAGFGVQMGDVLSILPRSVDEVTTEFGGDRIYDVMTADPAVAASINLLKLGALADDLVTIPVVPPKPGVPMDQQAPEVQVAQEYADFCRRLVDRLGQPFWAALWQLFDAPTYGAMLGEMTWGYVDGGPDNGRLVPMDVSIKPRESWAMVVDAAKKVRYIQGTDIRDGGVVVVPLGKFLLFVWHPRNGDPRGSSWLRPAFNPWNVKELSWPSLLRFIRKFGTPSLVGKTGKGYRSRPPVDSLGNPVAGAQDQTAEEAFAEDLESFQEASVLAVPEDCSVEVIETQQKGEAQQGGINLCNREIVLAITGAIRALMESEHGSRADSQTGQDNAGLCIRFLKRWGAACIVEQMYYRAMVLNFGKAEADQWTPGAGFGRVEHQDLAKILTAAGSVGYGLGSSQMAPMDEFLGLPVRDLVAEEDDTEPDPADPNEKDEPPEPGEGGGGQDGGGDGKDQQGGE